MARQATAAGGAVHTLLGNHELMNAQGELEDVSEQGLRSFGGRERRRQLFAPGGKCVSLSLPGCP